MNYYKFVSWDAVELEKVKAGRVPLAIAAADRGDIEHLQNPVYKIGGWAFSLREYCRRYWVKTRYYGICEYYAPNKTAIYGIIGRYNVLEIVEV